ncbi:hypothetical protein BD779DRAFT_1669499 [Infundibulicybe gibba]|nr:hypothetical protein BD779DRAFT_1669499 [Infundibulicybe gibba]
MPQQTDAATPTRLASISGVLDGKKLRIAGRMLSYDSSTGLVLLLDQDVSVLVDVSLCIKPWSSSWVRERLSTLMIIGHLEVSTEEFPIPTIPSFAPIPVVNPKLILRALLVIHAVDLDLEKWNAVIEEDVLS